MAADSPPAMLSVVIPAYNEARFVAELLRRVLAVDLSGFGLQRQVILVDDGSSDGTADLARAVPGVEVEALPGNQGKGAAVRAGLRRARGEIVVIQDADLEYEPADYLPMLQRLLQGDVQAVYGSRYAGGEGATTGHRGRRVGQSLTAYLGGRSLSLVARLCTGVYLSDTVTALKMVRRERLADFELETSGFELDHELTCKLLAHGARIAEVPIHYAPRSRSEGKKIGFRDWLQAVSVFLRFRRG